jgi:hypothetical protein
MPGYPPRKVYANTYDKIDKNKKKKTKKKEKKTKKQQTKFVFKPE